jgi:hypothetical protein
MNVPRIAQALALFKSGAVTAFELTTIGRVQSQLVCVDYSLRRCVLDSSPFIRPNVARVSILLRCLASCQPCFSPSFRCDSQQLERMPWGIVIPQVQL